MNNFKTLAFSSVFLISLATLFGQGDVQVAPAIFMESYADQDLSNNFEEYIFRSTLANSSSNTIQVKWQKLVTNTCPLQWDILVADRDLTYLPTINESVIPFSLYPQEKDVSFQINIYPRMTAGCCQLAIRFFNAEMPEQELGTIEYSIGVNDDNCLATSTQTVENIANTLTISPNPTTNSIQLNSSFEFDELLVFNAFGELVLTQKASPGAELKLNTLATGMYYLRTLSAGQVSGNASFVKN